jgi:hypothetical protein
VDLQDAKDIARERAPSEGVKVESMHMQLRKIIKTRGYFPNDDAATKLIWLALRNMNDGKVRSAREWKLAMNQFAVLYGDRFGNPAAECNPPQNTKNLIRPKSWTDFFSPFRSPLPSMSLASLRRWLRLPQACV